MSLPWLWKKYGHILKERIKTRTFWKNLNDRQRFLFLWTFVTWFFFECMATKYPTYTLPYLPPLAIGLACAASRLDLQYWVKRTALAMALLFTVLSFVLAAPLCRQASGWDAARLVTARHAPGVPVYVYGGRYPVSFTYYSGIPAPPAGDPAADPGTPAERNQLEGQEHDALRRPGRTAGHRKDHGPGGPEQPEGLSPDRLR